MRFPAVRFEMEDDHAIMAMVRSGLGVSILPETILSSAPAGLVAQPLAPEASRSIALAAVSFKKMLAGSVGGNIVYCGNDGRAKT